MDKAFIEKHQIVERYLTGKLPFKGVQEFERFCHDHPEIIEELQLADRLHAGMRLLEASGRPAGWREPKLPWWQRTEVTYGLAALCAALLIGLWILADRFGDRGDRLAAFERQVEEGSLAPPSTSRTVKVVPHRGGANARPNVSLRIGNPPQLVELKIDMSFARQNAFRLTIDKKGQARAGTIHNLLRDSNGELRLFVNTSSLTQGDYQVAIEGVTSRGVLVPVAWMTVRVSE